MPLDMNVLYRQVEKMVEGLAGASPGQQLAAACEFLCQADPEVLRGKLRQREKGTAKIPWLVAAPVSTLAQTFPLPRLPSDVSVVAADGSSIPPDRHSPLRYFVLNIGYAVLTYGSAPSATLCSEAQFCFEEHTLYIDPDDKRIPIEGARLGIHMSVAEIAGLLHATQHAATPMVALSDGSLILWNLQSEEATLQRHFMDRLLETLDAFRTARIPIASYISFPGSHDVVNSLRMMLCDVQSGGCTRCPQATDEQTLCRFMGTLWDRQIFSEILVPGQRSDIFESQSAILNQYREHHIQFFYLDVGGEIARIEAPQWVMNDPQMLDLVHCTVFDQCRRSSQYPPYPAVLIEAHEQAVISTVERQTIQDLVEQAMVTNGRLYVRSAKDLSKRSRGV